MTKTDLFFLKYNALLVIIVSVVYNMTLEHLIKHGYSSSSVLLYRGILTFLLTVVLSLKGGERIIPNKISGQALRILLSGIGLLMIFQSYKYLEASTVFMVARLDIPFTLLLGYLLKKHQLDFKVWLSALALLLVLSIFFYAKHIGEGAFGLALVITAELLIACCYLLIKKATHNENNFVIVNTTNIGCITVGLLSGLFFGNLNQFHLADLWIFAIASVSQFLLNYIASILYRHSNVERVQRPYLVAALVILVVEQLWHGRLFDLHHSLIIILVVSVIYLITLKELSFKIKWSNKNLEPNETTN